MVFAHANLLVNSEMMGGAFIPGYSGVDIFFVLSGFIISYRHLNDLGHPSKFKPYVTKRALRILPAYWLYTAFVVLCAFTISFLFNYNILPWTKIDASHILGSFLFFPTDIINNAAPVLPVAWTLTYEVMFYAIFGLAIALPAKAFKYIATTWLVLILLSNAFAWSQSLFFRIFTDLRNIEFLMGCAIAYLVQKRWRATNAGSGRIALFFGCLLLIAFWFNAATGFRAFPKNADAFSFGISYALIVFGGVIIELKGNRLHKSSKFDNLLNFIGDASYSIYLVHFTIIFTLNRILKHFINHEYLGSFLGFIVISLIAILVGCAAYVFVEKPAIIRLRQWLSPSVRQVLT